MGGYLTAWLNCKASVSSTVATAAVAAEPWSVKYKVLPRFLKPFKLIEYSYPAEKTYIGKNKKVITNMFFKFS